MHNAWSLTTLNHMNSMYKFGEGNCCVRPRVSWVALGGTEENCGWCEQGVQLGRTRLTVIFEEFIESAIKLYFTFLTNDCGVLFGVNVGIQ